MQRHGDAPARAHTLAPHARERGSAALQQRPGVLLYVPGPHAAQTAVLEPLIAMGV